MPTKKIIETVTSREYLIPDGYEFVDYRLPKKGESYVYNASGEILTASFDYEDQKTCIIKKIEPKVLKLSANAQYNVQLSGDQLQFIFALLGNISPVEMKNCVDTARTFNKGVTIKLDSYLDADKFSDVLYRPLKEIFQ